MKLSNLDVSTLKTSRLKLLFMLARGRLGQNNIGCGRLNKGHLGWYTMEEIRTPNIGSSAGVRLRELRRENHFPIIMEELEGKGRDKTKHTYYCLDLNVQELDWDKIILEGRSYVYKRKPVEFRFVEDKVHGWGIICKCLDLRARISDIKSLELVKIQISTGLALLSHTSPEKYAKFIKKYNPDNIREVD